MTAERDDGTQAVFSCAFLMNCSGYYRYDEGFTPEFAGIEDFEGRVIHPQHWPEEPEYEGKRVVVIGSGATAVTLVPAMAKDAAHVTMLQRSPSYILAVPGEDPVAEVLRRCCRRAPSTRSCAGRTSSCRRSPTGSHATVPASSKRCCGTV